MRRGINTLLQEVLDIDFGGHAPLAEYCELLEREHRIFEGDRPEDLILKQKHVQLRRRIGGVKDEDGHLILSLKRSNGREYVLREHLEKDEEWSVGEEYAKTETVSSRLKMFWFRRSAGRQLYLPINAPDAAD